MSDDGGTTRTERIRRNEQRFHDALPGDFRRTGTDPEDPAATEQTVSVDLPEDHREAWLICQMCVRTMRKRHRVEIRPDVLVCPICAGQPQDPALRNLDVWLALPLERRRFWIASRFGIDPATFTAAEVEVTEDRFLADVDGAPLAVLRMPMPASVRFGARPRMYWDVWLERGRTMS